MRVCIKRLLALSCTVLCLSPLPFGSEAEGKEKERVAGLKKDDLEDALMRFIRIPDESLPKGVQLVTSIRTAPILVPIERNPQVFAEKAQVKAVAKFFEISGEHDLEQIDRAVAAVYQEQTSANEIGVFGIHFGDEHVADHKYKQLIKLLSVHHAKTRDWEVIPKGSLLLFCFRDKPASEEAFRAVIDYFASAKFPPLNEP